MTAKPKKSAQNLNSFYELDNVILDNLPVKELHASYTYNDIRTTIYVTMIFVQ